MKTRVFAKVAGTLASVAVGAVLAASPAQASEGIPLLPNRVTCGITTCTAYWSVDRTAEMHAEWKETLVGAGGLAAGGLAFAGTLAAAAGASGPAAPIVGAAAAGAGVVIGARAVEFNHMINGAENDGRCLIYKYPKQTNGEFVGWFGSVHLDNKNCDQGPA